MKRCTGLEVRDALLLWCRDAIYIVDGFEQKEGDGLEGKINRVEMPTSTFYINLRPDNFVSMDRVDRIGENSLGVFIVTSFCFSCNTYPFCSILKENLHNWIDLIFRYNQRGREAVKVLTLISTTMSLFDTNGNVLATKELDSYDTHSRPSCAIATGCPEWTEEGIVAVTGHNNGDKRLWSLDYKNETLVMRHLVSDKIHSCQITCLRIPSQPEDTLLVGDKSGKISEYKSFQFENFSQQEQTVILNEMKAGTSFGENESSETSEVNENELDRTWM